MNIYQCNICRKTFKTQDGLNGHKRVHGPSHGQTISNVCCCLVTRQIVLVSNLEKHISKFIHDNTLDNKCKYCHSIIKRSVNFCSRSCQASYSNIKRGPMPSATKEKISATLKKSDINSKPKKHKERKTILGPFSKLYTCTCAHCNTKFVNRRQVKYCITHADLYKSNNRNRYRFTFSLSAYPDIFGDYSILLKEYGMWSPTNTNGLTRDHKVSVNEAIKNNYDPYYITHPLNCELMPWHQNNKKNTECSLSYQELVSLVDQYDNS